MKATDAVKKALIDSVGAMLQQRMLQAHPTMQEYFEQIRKMADMKISAETVPYYNTSPHDVRFEIAGEEFRVAPGKTAQIPKWYARTGTHQMPSAIETIAPQMKPARRTCDTCSGLIGQADDNGEIVIWQHNAPCGLPCTGRGQDSPNAHELSHTGDSTCARCMPKKCPACKGKGNLYRGKKKIPIFSDRFAIHGESKEIDDWEKCARCRGDGRLHGLELFDGEA